MRNRWPASLGSLGAWLSAFAVLLLAATLVVLDLTVTSVRDYWARHQFTSSVVAGLLVLLVTVLFVDRATHLRQFRRQARAIAVQAGVLVVQASRTADAIAAAGPSTDDREAAADELRTYMVMLLTSAPLLIDAPSARTFLETGQRIGVQMARVMLAADDSHGEQPQVQLDDEVRLLREAAAPLASALNPEERAVIGGE